MSEGLEEKGDKVFNRLYQKQSIETNNILDRTMNDLYDTFSDNPAELEKQFTKAKDKIFNTIKNKDLQLELEMNYLTKKNNFLINADRNFKIKEDNETKQSIFDKANNLYREAAIYYGNRYAGNNTPEMDTDYKINSELLNTQLQSKGNFNQSLFNNKDIEGIQKNFRQANMDAFYNYANQAAEINKINDMLKEWHNNPATIMEKYDLTQEEYEKQVDYLNKLKTNLEDEDDNLTITQKVKRTYYASDIETRYSEFDIGEKNSKRNVIRNKDLNNVMSLLDFRNYNKKLKSDGLIGDDEYNKYMKNTAIAFNNLITEQKAKHDPWGWSPSGEQYILEKVNELFKNKNMCIEDRIFFTELMFNTCQEKGIDLSKTNNKKEINNIFDVVYKNTIIQNLLI